MTAAIKEALSRVVARLNKLTDEEFRTRLDGYHDNAITVALMDASRVLGAFNSLTISVKSRQRVVLDLDLANCSACGDVSNVGAANDQRFQMAA